MATKGTCDIARLSKFQLRLQPDSPLLMATVLIADDSRVHVQLLTRWLQDLRLGVIATFDAIQACLGAVELLEKPLNGEALCAIVSPLVFSPSNQ